MEIAAPERRDRDPSPRRDVSGAGHDSLRCSRAGSLTMVAPHRILLTRTVEGCAEWAAAVRCRGAVPVPFPCITCRDLGTDETRVRLAREVPRASWIAFTSAQGVGAFKRIWADPRPAAEGLASKVATVGRATAEAARSLLGRVDLVGTGGTAAALAAELAPILSPSDRVLLAVAANAGSEFSECLRGRGHCCARVDVYETIPVPAPSNRRAASDLGARDVFLASPSAVTGFCNQVRFDSALNFFTIGPTTTRAAQAAGIHVKGESLHPSLSGLMEALRCAT